MKKDKIKFVKISILFIFIFLFLTIILVSLPAYIFIKSNEFINTENIVKIQNNNIETILYGVVYSNQADLYKLNLVNSNQCKIVSLGSSRVMQFREHFFTSPFCNAGGGATKINEFRPFLKNLKKEKQPKLLIIGLDQYFFNNNWDSGLSSNTLNLNEKNPFVKFQSNLLKIYLDYFQGKINLSKINLNDKTKIGLKAIMTESGFRNDGSYFYGEVIKNGGIKHQSHPDYNFTDTLRRIQYGNSRFQYGKNISSHSLKELELLLKYCSKNNIQVIGFLPPYAKEVWKEMNIQKERYEYIFKIEKEIQPIFEKYNYELYDFTDLKKIKASNCEVIDGYHGSEKAYLRILIYMTEKSKILKNYVDTNSLKKKLMMSNGCFSTVEK